MWEEILFGVGEQAVRDALDDHTQVAPKKGRVDCKMRVRQGKQAGVSRFWRTGRATPQTGHLTFKRWKSREIEVTGVMGIRRRRVRDLRFETHDRIVTLETPTATLEWGIRDRYVLWAVNQLRPSAGSEASAEPPTT